MTDASCPKCSGDPVVIETATARPAERRADLVLRCSCGVQWTVTDLTLEAALDCCVAATTRTAWVGASHAARGMLLEVSGRADEAYEAYATALRCNDTFDRAFCHERRGAYEAAHGWLRNALRSMRLAVTEDRRASGLREGGYRAAIETLESAMTAQGIWFAPADRNLNNARWLRECELELPPGYGARNEVGQPLSDDVIEVERRVRAGRWDDAVAQLRALRAGAANKFIDAIGYASRGAELARATGHREAALAMQALVVDAYVIWASGSTSGAEGMGRTADVERERQRLRDWERGRDA
ncbi:MAG: hypothetical protein H0T89_14770 [Deltaproteobacteria bacterium]|nr:hypothetical protein [Deltaproteobacteria bacterium]MDQ3295480.1 hypothetical protein [Myxococcota bacterium]